MNLYLIVAVVAAGTYLTRALPFVFLKDRSLSDRTLRIIDALPYATISLLVVYSFKDVQMTNLVPTLVATGVCVGTYLWKHSTILSIASSTIIYMILLAL